MCVERAVTSDICPNWRRPAANMRARYLAHPDLRTAFIQIVDEPDAVYVVTDEALPETVDQAVAVVVKWREANAQTVG